MIGNVIVQFQNDNIGDILYFNWKFLRLFSEVPIPFINNTIFPQK